MANHALSAACNRYFLNKDEGVYYDMNSMYNVADLGVQIQRRHCSNFADAMFKFCGQGVLKKRNIHLCAPAAHAVIFSIRRLL